MGLWSWAHLFFLFEQISLFFFERVKERYPGCFMFLLYKNTLVERPFLLLHISLLLSYPVRFTC